ncbi:MAG: hypothetical protein WCJ54_08550, partial [Actinomycetota bacterium]
GKEKQTDQEAVAEVAQQTPAQIASAGAARVIIIKKKYQQNSQILANLVTNDPLLNPNVQAKPIDPIDTPPIAP